MTTIARQNVRICRLCPDCEAQPKNGGCRGPCMCLVNREDIHDLAKRNFCPAGRFPSRYFGSCIAFVIRVSGAKWIYYQVRQSAALIGKLLGLVPPDFKVPYHCGGCGRRQEWLDRQHEKWKRRRKRRRHARVLRKARRRDSAGIKISI
jgi:hypothetical protein